MKRTMTAAVALSFVATAALAQDGGPRYQGGGEGRGRPPQAQAQPSQSDAQAQPRSASSSRGERSGERPGPRRDAPQDRPERAQAARPQAAPAQTAPSQAAAQPVAPQLAGGRRGPAERPQTVNPRNQPGAPQVVQAPRSRGLEQPQRAEQPQRPRGDWNRGARPDNRAGEAPTRLDRNGDGRPDGQRPDAQRNADRNGDGRADGPRIVHRNDDGRLVDRNNDRRPDARGGDQGWNRDGGRGGWDRDHRGPAERPSWARHDGRGNRDYGRPRYDVVRFPHVFQTNHRYRLSNYYVQPYGFYDYAWAYGDFLPWGWYGPSYWIDDWFAYGLPVPPIGCEWVRVGHDAVLVDTFTGRVLSVARLLFW